MTHILLDAAETHVQQQNAHTDVGTGQNALHCGVLPSLWEQPVSTAQGIQKHTQQSGAKDEYNLSSVSDARTQGSSSPYRSFDKPKGTI